MLKKYKKQISLSALALVVLLFISIGLPLPKNIIEAFWSAKLNNFSQGHTLELEKTRLLLIRGFDAKLANVTKNDQAVFSARHLKVRHSIPFVFTGKGRIKLSSDSLTLKNLPNLSKVLDFLSNTLGYPLSEGLNFKEASCGLEIKRKEVILDYLILEAQDIRIAASGYLQEDEKISFLIDVFVSDELAGQMPQEGQMLLFGSAVDGFNKISLEIYGLPQEPSYRIKANFLELNIG